MRGRGSNGTLLLMVTLALLVVAVGCRKGGPSAESDYTGSWAQVPDIVARIGEPNIPDREFNIVDFKAVADGTTDCRPAIMEAIQACENAGGGRVLVPAGTYLVNGPLYLVSDMNLHLAEGAHLKFGTKFDDYLPLVLTRWGGTRIYNYCPFLYAYRKKNVAVTGAGTLDGQAKDTWTAWTEKQSKGLETSRKMNAEGNSVVDRFLGDGYFLRPSMVTFFGCEHVLVEGVKIVDSPYWCLHPTFSKKVTIRNVQLDSHNPDNDAIVVDSCEDIRIEDVTIDTSGAGVAVKSGAGREGREMGRPSRNVYIHDCTFNTEKVLTIDGAISGGVYNVFAENCEAGPGLQPTSVIADEQTRESEIVHVRYREFPGVGAQEPNVTNLPPDVYAGPDAQLGEQGGTVALSGAVSDDGKPSGKLTYSWSVVQGEVGAVSISDATALKTQATFSKPGVYILKLEASDGEASGRHFTMVKVGEQPEGMEAVTRPIFSTDK